jgi:hypothetical protein
MLMDRLVRPRALERFFFGTAIWSLYRAVDDVGHAGVTNSRSLLVELAS